MRAGVRPGSALLLPVRASAERRELACWRMCAGRGGAGVGEAGPCESRLGPLACSVCVGDDAVHTHVSDEVDVDGVGALGAAAHFLACGEDVGDHELGLVDR